LVQRAGGAYSYFAHELGQKPARLLFQLEKRSYHRADAWAAKSIYTGTVTARLFGLKPGPNAILYNPVQTPNIVPSFAERSTNQVVFTGTLAAKKGVIPLIDAWPLVHARISHAELHCYGKDTRGPEGGSMQAYLQQRLPPQHRASVHFHGHVPREVLFQALSLGRVAVFPSFTEGFAWAPLEAMAYGCPTIYTRLGSGSELILHGRDGLLVAPDRAEQIAAAITGIIEGEALAQRLGEAGRQRVLNSFTLEKLLPINEAFFSELSKSHRALASN
jgi:glycosyltransferase involved in cell wall biosynthesis